MSNAIAGVATKCQQCGATFQVDPYRAGVAKFCSVTCKGLASRTPNRGWADRTCRTCAAPFRVRTGTVNRGGGIYCCRSCAASAITARIALDCANCGKSFETWPSRVKRGAGKFCSPACRVDGRSYCYQQSKIGSDTIELILQQMPMLAVPELRVGRWAIDLAFPTLMVALELDGAFWHSHPPRIEADRRKDDALAKQGWRVVRIPINNGDTADDLARAAIERIASLP